MAAAASLVTRVEGVPPPAPADARIAAPLSLLARNVSVLPARPEGCPVGRNVHRVVHMQETRADVERETEAKFVLSGDFEGQLGQ